MPKRAAARLRPLTLAPWLLAGLVAAVAYALWPDTGPAPRESAEPPPVAAVPPAGALPGADAPLEDWIHASNQLMDHGQFDLAIAGYTHALHLDSQNVPLWVDRGACRHAVGDLEGAEADFRHALTLEPAHPTAHFNLGIVYYSRGLADSARPHFNFVVSAAPGTPEAARASALLSQPGTP